MPQSWAPRYGRAVAAAAEACGQQVEPPAIARAITVLERYNTRLTPRILEIPEGTIFAEVTEALGFAAGNSELVADAFFDFFRHRVIAYPETFAVLQHLRAAGVEVGVLTDVPYGMDRARVEADLAAAGLDGLITVLLTSVDVGRRKPSSRGFVRLAAELGVGVGDLLYVGNEQKDIGGANTAGARSVLIDRDDRRPTWGAWATITSLEEVVALLESLGHASGTGPSR